MITTTSAALSNPVLITTQPGPRNAHSDARTGLRFYRWQGEDYPSVTTIRRLAGLPFNLHQWALSKVVTRAIDQNSELTRLLTRERRPRERVLEKNRAKEAAKWLRAAATEERDIAAALGTEVHDAATSGKAVSEVSGEVAPRLRQFYAAVEAKELRIIAVERQVFNLRHGYAGTFDILGVLPDGRIMVIDLKTGKGTYMEHAIQLMLYSMAEFVGESDVIDRDLTEMLKSAQGMEIIHLTNDSWKWQEVEATPKLYRAALGLLDFAKFAHEHTDIESLVVDEMEGAATL